MSLSFNDFNPPSNSSLSLHELHCSDSTVGRDVLTVVSLAYTLLVLPLSVFVLYLGFQRWRQQRSVSSGAVMTHSDFFTYNMSVTEVIKILGFTLSYCSNYIDLPLMSSSGLVIGSFSWPGQALFPILTCVEHYMAVVHPITYRGLRQMGGVRIRNISTGCVWLICFLWAGFQILVNFNSYYRRGTAAFMLILYLFIMVFCSLSVLRVLIRRHPGKAGRFQGDQSKQRAIYTVLIIMAVLWLKFGGNMIVSLIKLSQLLSVMCVGEVLIFLFFLPSSVVLPLLFLHRAGKLPNSKYSSGSG